MLEQIDSDIQEVADRGQWVLLPSWLARWLKATRRGLVDGTADARVLGNVLGSLIDGQTTAGQLWFVVRNHERAMGRATAWLEAA